MKLRLFHRVLFSCFAFLLTSGIGVLAQDKDWRPVTPDELQSKTPVVEPDADAEAIFWDVRVDDSSADELALKHYVRVKIFTERGRDQFSKHDIVFPKGTRIKDVEARVTKPDGTVVFLKKDDVLEREIIKANGFKIKAKSFALPGLEIGSIIEYRYKEVQQDSEANMRLVFQHELPIRTISYYVRPFAGDRAMAYQAFNVGKTAFEKDKDGFYRATMTNVPAFHEEPNMLPEDEIKSWVYIYYVREVPKNSDEYWSRITKSIYESSKDMLKPNDDVKVTTAQVIAGATSDDEKLHKIFDFTKTQIRNTTYGEKVTDDEKKRAASIKSPGDVLKNKLGSASDVDALFGAMARAAGFETHLALSGDRSELFFNPRIPNLSLMLNSSSVAVKIGGDWRFFSPAGYFTPYGMLGWPEEDQLALITDSKELIWKPIPLTPSQKSVEKRSGKFHLLEDGTLEGEARIEYTGHIATSEKLRDRGDSLSVLEDEFKDKLKSQILGSAEISSLVIENLKDPEKPVVYTFKIRIPGYASRTGKRIFFQPGVFERSSKPRFVASSRKSDIYFNYPFSEQDDLTIELPSGFQLENADAPADAGDQQGISSHKVKMAITTDNKTLTYNRTFSFGNNGYLRFGADAYPALKTLFESFNRAEVHQLTLRQDTK